MQIGQFPASWHLALEMLSFWAAFRLYRTLRKRDSLNLQKRIPILLGGIIGAAVGSKVFYLLEDPSIIPAALANWQLLVDGKSLVGALVGGWVAIELSKKLTQVKSATGDSFVLPLAVGMIIGRIGCFLCGLADHTYGIPTDLPWGMDFGDGVRRHPAQLYEIIFLCGFVLAWTKLVKANLQQGELWKIFMLSYMTFRFFVEFIKPVPHVYLGLDIEQVVAIGTWAYYTPYLLTKFQRPKAELIHGD